MAGPIGRIPAKPFHLSRDDDELELLKMQLSAMQSAQYHDRRHHTRKPQFSNFWFSTQPRFHKLKQSLMTLWSDRGLLDEGQEKQIQKILHGIVNWDFNAFTLDRLCTGHNLATLCTHVFKKHDLLKHFKLNALTVWKFFAIVEEGYHRRNPYHNAVHAADVTQAMNCFLHERMIAQYLTPLERMAAMVAAVCHDLDHPGLNEKFLIAVNDPLAILYNNISVLENHHLHSAIACLHASGLAQELCASDLKELESIIHALILATDISRQHEFLSQLSYYLDHNMLDLSKPQYRLFMLQISMKCADISNPARSWNISRLWSYRACEEFFRQGDQERFKNIPITPFCDRHGISIAKVQSGFYRFIAFPLFDVWRRAFHTPLSHTMMQNLISNQARWDLLMQQEIMANESIIQKRKVSNANSLIKHEIRPEVMPSTAAIGHTFDSSEDIEKETWESNTSTAAANTSMETIDLKQFSRRHSLPQLESLSKIFTSMTHPVRSFDEASPVETGSYSFGSSKGKTLERRRSTSVMRHHEPYHQSFLQKRKVFGLCSQTSRFSTAPRLSFAGTTAFQETESECSSKLSLEESTNIVDHGLDTNTDDTICHLSPTQVQLITRRRSAPSQLAQQNHSLVGAQQQETYLFTYTSRPSLPRRKSFPSELCNRNKKFASSPRTNIRLKPTFNILKRLGSSGIRRPSTNGHIHDQPKQSKICLGTDGSIRRRSEPTNSSTVIPIESRKSSLQVQNPGSILLVAMRRFRNTSMITHSCSSLANSNLSSKILIRNSATNKSPPIPNSAVFISPSSAAAKRTNPLVLGRNTHELQTLDNHLLLREVQNLQLSSSRRSSLPTELRLASFEVS